MRAAMRTAAAFLVCVSCTLPALDLASKGCPCTSGFTCDVPSGRCIVSGSPPPAAPDSGGPAQDGGKDSGCPGHPNAILCDNFDDKPLGALWSATTIANASLTLSQAQAQSPPSSLLAELTSPDGGKAESNAALVLNLPRAYPRLRTSCDIYLDRVGQRSAIIGSIYVHNGVRYYSVLLFERGGGSATEIMEDGDLADGGKFGASHPFKSLPLQSWTRVIIEVDFGTAPTVTLTLEAPPFFAPATPVLDHVPITPTLEGTTTSVYAGIDYVLTDGAGWRVYFDNVVIETP